jgi:putative transposase
MPFDPNKHNRRSIRLPSHDYSQTGEYFVTLCVQNRECLFGGIENGKMHINDAGRMVEKWHLELANKFTNVKIDEFIVMPNHFHSVVIIVPFHSVGADLRVCPSQINDAYTTGEHAGSPLRDTETNTNDGTVDGRYKTGERNGEGEHTGSPLQETPNHGNLSTIMQWFKTMTTNEYIRNVKTKNWTPFAGKLWQRNFYEHINRDEKELFRIRQYIRNNPLNWDSDGENPCGKSTR